MEQSKKWYDYKFLVVLLCIFFFPVGLYALWKANNISKGWKIGVTIVIGIFFIIAITDDDKSSKNRSSDSSVQSSSDESSSISKEPDYITVGQILKTDYFDVTVNKVSIEGSVRTGNQFADLKAEEGIAYLIINTTFKNTDNESRMIIDGEVLINYNGKEYTFDKSETVMLEGWGILLDQINPLTSKTTNLVYKIPTEIKGPAYYRPGRSDSDDIIYLGNI